MQWSSQPLRCKGASAAYFTANGWRRKTQSVSKNMNPFQMQLLYYIGVTTTILALCVFSGTALANACRKHLRFIQIWLSPFFVGNLISVLAVLIQDYHFFTGTRETVPEYALTMTLPIISGLFGIYGFSRLGRIIAATAAGEGGAFAGVEPAPMQEEAWPSPPNKPAP